MRKSILATEVTEGTEKIYFFLTSYLCALCVLCGNIILYPTV